MDRLNNPSKIETFELAEELKDIMRPLFQNTWMTLFLGNFRKT